MSDILFLAADTVPVWSRAAVAILVAVVIALFVYADLWPE